eukprot:TRINITY_DN107777_c0_g4_i1.p1 TRINITY_DN107777_c0_g4~~TRINITY_DN107777_c0_g4_i1.p1  ORF type:complete len:152 (-),score=51.51 TRINITY_DN107777_c0_g4_i1:122-577(-)
MEMDFLGFGSSDSESSDSDSENSEIEEIQVKNKKTEEESGGLELDFDFGGSEKEPAKKKIKLDLNTVEESDIYSKAKAKPNIGKINEKKPSTINQNPNNSNNMAPAATKSGIMVPQHVLRKTKNVVTEDVEKWNSAATNKKQKAKLKQKTL